MLTLFIIDDLNVFMTLRVMIDVKFIIIMMMFFKFILQCKKTYFVIYIIFVIKLSEQRIREINVFIQYLISKLYSTRISVYLN